MHANRNIEASRPGERLFWIMTPAKKTFADGTVNHIGYVVSAAHETIDSMIAALNGGKLVSVDRLEIRSHSTGRYVYQRTRIALSSQTVVAVMPYRTDEDSSEPAREAVHG
jgi:hypothetical protein